MNSESGNVRNNNASGGKNKTLKFLLVIILLLILLGLGVLLYLLYFDEERDVIFFEEDDPIVDMALDLRESVVSLAVESTEEGFENYSDLALTKGIYTYNTCGERGPELKEREWSRNWLYLIYGDILYEYTSDDAEYIEESSLMANSLYEQYYGSEWDMLSVAPLHGRESYCLPYYLLESLQEDSDFSLDEKRKSLARDLCHDFYYSDSENILWPEFEEEKEYKKLSPEQMCEEESCLSDDDFYRYMESLLDVSDVEDVDWDEFDEMFEQENMHFLTFVFVDEYIVAYDNDLDYYVSWINHKILRNWHDIILEERVENEEVVGERVCSPSNRESIENMMLALVVKGDFLEKDGEKYKRNKDVLNLMFDYCYDSEEEFKERVFAFSEGEYEVDLSHQIEIYYLLSDFLSDFDLREYLLEFEQERFVEEEYKGEKYLFIDEADRWAPVEEDECYDVEISFVDYPKVYFYLMYHSLVYE